MANQKEIRVKIKSTKKTMKITSAMKLVAAAKVNKMQKKLLQARPFTEKISDLFANLYGSLSEDDIQANPLFATQKEPKKVLLISISSDRGLCGAYNTNIIKATFKRIQDLQAEGKEVKLITIGRKTKNAFTKNPSEHGAEIIDSLMNLNSIPTTEEAELIAEKAIQLFINGEVDKVELISTRFISLIANQVECKSFLPIENINATEETETSLGSEALLEPDAQTLIDTLAPMYTQNRIYQSLLESTTSELASRMTAMSNATNNAKDFIKKLTLEYNKARQASITQEISEIVGGAAALG